MVISNLSHLNLEPTRMQLAVLSHSLTKIIPVSRVLLENSHLKLVPIMVISNLFKLNPETTKPLLAILRPSLELTRVQLVILSPSLTKIIPLSRALLENSHLKLVPIMVISNLSKLNLETTKTLSTLLRLSQIAIIPISLVINQQSEISSQKNQEKLVLSLLKKE